MQQIMSALRAAIFLTLGLGAASVAPKGIVQAPAKLGLTRHVLGLLQGETGVQTGINVTVAGPLLREALQDVEDEVGDGIDVSEIDSLVAGLAAMKASHKATPGMDKFVSNVTTLIDTEMSVKVLHAHNMSQKVMDAVMRNFHMCKRTKRKADVIVKKLRGSAGIVARNHKKCRKLEQGNWVGQRDCRKLVATKRAVMLSECGKLRDLSKSFRRSPVSEAKNCKPKRGPENYGNFLLRNYRWFAKKVVRYNIQKIKCDKRRADYAQEKPRCDKTIRTWQKKKASCNSEQSSLEGSVCTFAKLMHKSCDERYWGCYEESKEMWELQVPILKKMEKDRKGEWRALQRIKCLLGVFAGGDGDDKKKVDASVIDTCKVATHDTKHLTLKIPRVPAPESCVALPNTPCSTPFYKQEYYGLPKNARATRCSQCVVFSAPFATKPTYWLQARNYHPQSRSWHNRGSGPHLKGIHKYGSQPWVDSRKGYGASYPVTSIMGTWRTGIYFGRVIPNRYTVCSLTRYTGGRYGRILNGGRGNWLHGHWHGRAGIAHYGGWKTSHGQIVRPRTNWVAMCGRNGGGTPGNINVNGRPKGIRRGGNRPEMLAINYGWAGWERSDWAVSEIVVFQEQLPDAEMAKVVRHLLAQLKAPKKPGPDKEYQTAAQPCTAPQLSKLDPGQWDHRSFRCKTGYCIPRKGMCNGFRNCKDGSDEAVCKEKKMKPNPAYYAPAKSCSIKQRLKLRKGMGDDKTFRCEDGYCTHITGKCNGFKNCIDGSDEFDCFGKKKAKGKEETIMVIKYTKRWPHCSNIRCFGNTKVEDANKYCLSDARCDGFSFTASKLRRGRGGGCYKTKCKVDRIRGYGRGSHGYIVKMKKMPIATCKDLQVSYPVWGSAARGLDFSPYTRNLHWMGCMGNGCKRDKFYCRDTPSSLEFGASGKTPGALRALLDDGLPTFHRGCCSGNNPDSVCNTPQKVADVEKLCQDLGYLGGKVIAAQKTSSTCPEVTWTTQENKPGKWFSKFDTPSSFGFKYKCEGIDLDEDSDVELGVQMGMKKVSEWTDTEEVCASQLPTKPWGDCAKEKSDKIGIQITYKSGYYAFAVYEGVAEKWGKSFDDLKAKMIRGWFQSSPEGALHYLDYKSPSSGTYYPIAWSKVGNLWSENFDVTSRPEGCSDGKAQKKGWGNVKFQLYCKVKEEEKEEVQAALRSSLR